MYGFGDEVKINKIIPYWGMFSGHLKDIIEDHGYDCHCASVGPLSSAWDRACELYAQLFGLTVDYGVAHSKKHDHKRFGRTYEEPLIKDFGKINEDGCVNKVDLIGHSFGGETIRMLTSLLCYGSEEEREVTDDDDISPLFTGNNGGLVHSVTTIASPHNGITSFYANRYTFDIANYFTFILSNIIGNTHLNDIYDVHLEQFGLSAKPDEDKHLLSSLNAEKINKVVHGQDHVYYDLSLHGSKEMNKHIKMDPQCYYFSFATCSTQQKSLINQEHVPNRKTSLALRKLATDMGKYSINLVNDIEIDEKWLPSDGAANTYSSLHPFDEEYVNFDKHNINSGIWNVMDIQYVDHMQIVGKVYLKSDKEKVKNFYLNHIKLINCLEN